MLERNGITCTLCSSAKDIVKAIRGKDYDLLLSDILMPGTSGFDLLDLLRNSNVGNSREIPVIAMTARGDREKEAFFSCRFYRLYLQTVLFVGTTQPAFNDKNRPEEGKT